MGREWYWSSKSMKRVSGDRDAAAGCMSSVLQFFDFHQFQCYSNQQQRREGQQEDRCSKDSFLLDTPKGVEAPRNSLELELELEESPIMAAPFSSSPSTVKEEHIIFSAQLHPLKSAPPSEKNDQKSPSSSENASSQGSKTPSLVARLMGLDLLPGEISSATSSPVFRLPELGIKQSRLRDSNFTSSRYDSGTHSLPDTPRISLARRSDVDPRLSLQLSKANTDVAEFSSNISPLALRSGRKRETKTKLGEEGRSPGRYAKEIVKQVKESVSRRVGVDITNISRTRDHENNSPTIKKMKKHFKASEVSTTSTSPRLRLSDPKNRLLDAENQTPGPKFLKPQIPLVKETKTKPKAQPLPLPKSTAKCRKASCERFTRKPKTAPPRETLQNLHSEVICKKKVHRAVPSSPNRALVPVVSGPAPCPSYPLGVRDDHTVSAEFRYVRAALERTGIETQGPVSVPFTKWFSPAHPLDPTLFHSIETDGPETVCTVGSRADRRLLFHLADEILAELLKPHFNLKPWIQSSRARMQGFTGAQLLDRLWARVCSVPAAHCETLQDIDALVGSDMPETRGGEEVEEPILVEIGRDILDWLLEETCVGLRGPREGVSFVRIEAAQCRAQ